jgi:hypothetical protein
VKKTVKLFCLILVLLSFGAHVRAYDYEDRSDFVFAVLKYGGGGDWYLGLDGVRNLLLFTQRNTDIRVSLKEKTVSLLDDDLFLYPFISVNGHGNIFFQDKEVERLRTYLLNGGFLYVNDSYGLDAAFRREIKKVFPDHELQEVPFSHPIYHCYYEFPEGVIKVHKHESLPPKGYGIFIDNRLVVYYNYEADISDGWEEEWVHHDSAEIRNKALQMGVNLIVYAMTR